MNKKTKNKMIIFLASALFCSLGFIAGISQQNFQMSIFYAVLAIIFFVLCVTSRKTTAKKDAFQKMYHQESKNGIKTTVDMESIEKELGQSVSSVINTQNEATHSAQASAEISDIKEETHHVVGLNYRLQNLKKFEVENHQYYLSSKELKDLFYDGDKIYQTDFIFDKATLEEEPDNAYDPNAVKVLIDGVHVGYIKKGSCSHVKKLIHNGKIHGIDADLHGGKYKIIREYYDDDEDDFIKEIEEYESDYFLTLTIYVKNCK